MFNGLLYELRLLTTELRNDRIDRIQQAARLGLAIDKNTTQLAALTAATKDLTDAFAELSGTSGEPAVATWQKGMREPEGA